MATASVSNIPGCSVCKESLKTPKFLPCGHTFCLICIEQCIAERRGTFPCPLCNQKVNIPEGGAKNFRTNYKVKEIMDFFNNEQISTPTHQPNKPRDEPQPKCPKHKEDEMKDYCFDCDVGLCSKCIFAGRHKEHETLDIERDETRNKAIEKLERSQNFIQNRIKYLEKTRSTLLESFEELKSLCEDSCTKVTEKTEQIVSDVRKGCEQIIKDIRNNLEENRKKVENREMEITCEINLLEGNMESNISPSTKTTLNILQTLPRLLEIEKQDEKDYNLCIQYLQWVGTDFSLDIDQVGYVISKESFYIPGSYQFIFDISDIKKEDTWYYSKNKFRNNNLVWSCRVMRDIDDDLYIYIELSPVDNPKLDYCIIDSTISLLNIDDDSKTITESFSNERVLSGWSNLEWLHSITLSKLSDKNNGYLNSKNQFVIQFDIQQIRNITLK